MKRDYRMRQLSGMILLIAALLLSSGVLSVSSDHLVKNVLILNSYHKGLSWTDRETEGILAVLQESGLNCSTFVEYMDWKNYPTEENTGNIYTQLKYKYSRKHIDVVITTDDAALNFALKNRAELFSDAPVVFSGVNEEGFNKLTNGQSRVTGKIEIIDPINTINAAIMMNPGLKEIFLIYDNSESGLSTGAITIQAIQALKPDIKIHSLNEMGLMDILNTTADAPADSIILMTAYYKDPFGNVAGFEELPREVSRVSEVPVFHLYEFGLGNGAIGGSVASGKAEGMAAGRMAVRLLKGEHISQIPVETLQKIRYVFDYKQLERFRIPMDKIPKGSELVNKPFYFFEAYRNLVIMAAIIFALLCVFIIVLSFYLGKISRMKDQLQANNKELTESGKKLRQQYDELNRMQGELTSSENRYALLFNRMLNAFYILEPVMNEEGKLVDIRFVKVNPAFKKQTGLKSDDIIGKTWSEVYNYSNRNLNIYHRILLNGESRKFETYYPQENKYYLVNAFKISDNQIGVVFDNITEYRQAIREVTKLNEKLEKRVAERTEELQNAVNELEAFTYTVSHDLKSPLRAVDGYSRIILEDYGPELDGEASEMVQNIRNICKEMIDMINKLLQYSMTSKAAIAKEYINSEELFRSIYSELLSANYGRDVELVVETGLPEIYGDRVMIRQAIYNIMSNSFKFTKLKEHALINVGCTITGEEYVFYIKDNGIGFDMDYSGKLFGIFQRLHTSDEFEGTGIGLVTVKKIIQKHGGRVWIEGITGAGAVVYFTLPVIMQPGTQ